MILVARPCVVDFAKEGTVVPEGKLLARDQRLFADATSKAFLF